MDTSIEVLAPAERRRRRHSAEFKASVIRACRQPGVSMAAVALANGLNANMLRRWVADADPSGPVDGRRPEPEAGSRSSMPASTPPPSPPFIPLALPAPVADIRIELRRAGTTITVSWPVSAGVECANWLREILR